VAGAAEMGKEMYYVGKTSRDTMTRLAEHGKRFSKLTAAIVVDAEIKIGEAEASVLAKVVGELLLKDATLEVVRGALKGVTVLNKIMPSNYVISPWCN
jgi:hypothetical protein